MAEGGARGVRNEIALLSLSIGDRKTTENESDLNQLLLGFHSVIHNQYSSQQRLLDDQSVHVQSGFPG